MGKSEINRIKTEIKTFDMLINFNLKLSLLLLENERTLNEKIQRKYWH